MYLENCANAAQIVSAIAAIAIFYQFYQSARSLRSASYHDMVGNSISLLSNLVMDDRLLSTFLKGVLRPASLSDDEKQRWSLMLLATLRHFENIHYQRQMNALDEDHWNGYANVLKAYFARPEFKAWWTENGRFRAFFSAAFQEFLNGILATVPDEPTKPAGEPLLKGVYVEGVPRGTPSKEKQDTPPGH